MLTANKASRFDIAIAALESIMDKKKNVSLNARTLISTYKQVLMEHNDYIIKYGKDPDYVCDFLHASYPSQKTRR